MKKRPIVYVIAGPNGTGKTTFATQYLPKIADCRNFINADLIAKGLSPFDVDAAAMQAGRLFLENIREQVRRGTDFGFETTLSGIGYVKLFFLWIPGVALSLKRISNRVRLGGHNVPAEVVKRRFVKGLNNLFNTYMGLVDYCAIFDNSSSAPKMVYERHGEKEDIILPEIYANIIGMLEERK